MVRFSLDNDSNNAAADTFEITEAFEALDERKTGRIGIDLAYTLLLGLGYVSDYRKQDDFTPETLRQLSEQSQIDGSEGTIQLETMLRIVATHPALSQKNRTGFAQRGFQLVDRKRKGYIDASDVVELESEVVGKRDTTNAVLTSEEEASDMIETTQRMFGNNDENKENTSKRQQLVDAAVFQRIFASPSSREST